MNEYHEANNSFLTARLNELKSQFDQRMQQGGSFEEVKQVYLQIKELELKLNDVKWHSQKS